MVHSRCVAGGINADRWNEYTKELSRVLVAGGWCQMVEVYFNAQSNNGTLTDGELIQGVIDSGPGMLLFSSE